jgi:hypothetical protein
MKNLYKPPKPIKKISLGVLPSKGITSSRLWSFLKTINLLYEDNLSDNSILFFENIGSNFDDLLNIKFNKNDLIVIDDTYEGLLTQQQVNKIMSLGVNYAICSSNEKLTGKNVYFFSFHIIYSHYDNIYVQEEISPNLELRNNKFLSLNKQTRTHRLQLVDYLIEKNLLKTSIVSCDKLELHSLNENSILDLELKRLPPSTINRLYDILPLILDDTNNRKHLQNPLKFYQNSYWSLIGERDFYSDEYLGWTEKVLKSILFYHPFIVIGLPHTLHSLKQLGFKTFNNIIDESYDSIEDPDERFKQIKLQIDYLASLTIEEHHQLYIDLMPTLEYNRKLYQKLNITSSPVDLINQLTSAKLK